ncbi:hypothetical protein Tco_0064800 [Tanacetum coccineum]
MLEKTNYSSWASPMLLYIKGKPYEPRTETTPATVKARTYTDLTDEEKLRKSVDIMATKIVCKQESKLYDDFDTFTSMHGETIHSYYMRFAQLINDMHTIGKMQVSDKKRENWTLNKALERKDVINGYFYKRLIYKKLYDLELL